MATRARFGRLPRSAPSLTSTIVSLAAEYQRTRDRNIEDAWKNGGSFEGEKVTDKMLLDHWKQRRSEVSSDDPMWDYYNNTISQLEFNIEESKMGQKYAEEKVSDGQMAAFYRKWAAKLPKESEAYRQLMTQAAKFKAAAGARGRGRASNASAIAYSKKQQETYDTHEKPFDYISAAIASVAQQGLPGRGSILDAKDLALPDHGWSKLTNAGAESDPEAFSDVLNMIMEDPDLHARLTAGIKKFGDPDFNGVFDEETLSKYARRAGNGATIRMRRAHDFGDKQGEKDAKAAITVAGRNNIVIRAILGGPNATHDGFIENNEQQRATLDLVLNDPTRSVSEQRDALNDYTKWLHDEAIPNYQSLFPAGTFDPFDADHYNPDANGLVARANSTIGATLGEPQGQTLRDDLFGFGDQEAGTGSDAFKLGNLALGIHTSMELVDQGTGKQVKVNDAGEIDPNGTHWGVFKNDDSDLLEANVVPFAVPRNNYLGGEVRYTAATPVRVAMYGGVDPNTGRPIMGIGTDTSDPEVGQRMEITGPGGETQVMWGLWDKGEMVWTMDDPFAVEGRVPGEVDDRGNYVVGYVDPAIADQMAMDGQPEPVFNPSERVNRNLLQRRIYDPASDSFLDSVDGTPWDPSVDRDLAHHSPMTTAANASEASLKWVNAIGTDAVAKAEREWYGDYDPATKKWVPKPERFTADMQQMVHKGADPSDVVEAGARMLLNDVALKNREGFTPESQQASRRAEGMYQAGRAAASQGVSLEQYTAKNEDRKVRDELITNMAKWGISGTRPVEQGIRDSHGNIPRESQAQTWLSKGWTLRELLTQPGMDIAQANDLAAQISGGAVGTRLQGPLAPSLPRTGIGVSNTIGGRPTPYTNPYAPQGVVPNRPAPTRITKDDAIKPTPIKPIAPVRINTATGTQGIGTQTYVGSGYMGNLSKPTTRKPTRRDQEY